MKYKSVALGLGIPTDGLDETEKELQRIITEESLKNLYSKLPTSRMKFVVAAHYELGYSQELIAEILGIKQPSLQDEIDHIRKVLKGDPYKPRKYKGMVKVEDVMRTLMLLRQS